MVEINLLPAQYRKRSEPNIWRYASVAVPVLTVLGVLVFTVVQNTRLGNIMHDLDTVNGELAALEPSKREFDDLTRQKVTLQQTTQVAQTLQASKTYWSSDLARFVNALPAGGDVALNSLSIRALDATAQANITQQGLYNGKAVTKEFDLAGQAKNSQALVTFLTSFENNPNFGVDFKSAQRAPTAPVASSGGTQGGTVGTDNAPYSFTASVGLLGQPTPASGTAGTGASSGTSAPGAVPTVPAAPAAPGAAGGSNVR
ncbi:fimbrial assembly protein [Deinococcus sp.]|uniref:fimbrial assembly protein n=1 Tax=Deinococcus sp. TaxID=47478 RepID=UPI003CC648A3